jgi:hypothetical protein
VPIDVPRVALVAAIIVTRPPGATALAVLPPEDETLDYRVVARVAALGSHIPTGGLPVLVVGHIIVHPRPIAGPSMSLAHPGAPASADQPRD